jgi:hypothetical protein
MKWQRLVQLAADLPDVVEDVWFRSPALKVRGRAFVRLKEDGESVVFLLDGVEEQEHLIESNPDLYFITDHYRGYPAVLARLAALRTGEARIRLERAWRVEAPKGSVRAFDGRR